MLYWKRKSWSSQWLPLALWVAIFPGEAVRRASEISSEGQSFLRAASSGDAKLVKAMVDAGVDVNYRNQNIATSFVASDDTAALQYAAMYGHPEVVEVLIKAGADVNAVDNTGYSVLRYALEAGDFASAEALTKAGAVLGQAERQSERDWTLVGAAKTGNFALLQESLDKGANINYAVGHGPRQPSDGSLVPKDILTFAICDRGCTALYFAADAGHLEIVEALLKGGATANIFNWAGHSALHQAASHGYFQIAKAVIKAGIQLDKQDNIFRRNALQMAAENAHPDIVNALVDAGAKLDIEDKFGCTALRLAAQAGSWDATQALIKAGAKRGKEEQEWTLVGAARVGDLPRLKASLDGGAKVDWQDEQGKTALHWAAIAGQVEAAQELIKGNAKLALQDAQGYGPLQHAAKEGQTGVAQVLIKAGANLDEMAGIGVGFTPLQFAAQNGHLETVQVFIKEGANLDAKNNVGMAALTYAAEGGHVEVIQALIQAGANVNIPDMVGATPLHFAAKKGLLKAVKALIAAGADLNLTWKGLEAPGSTPLHVAARHWQSDVVKALIEAKADLNIIDDKGDTALHCAAEQGDLPSVQALIAAKADLNTKNGEGSSALIVAARRKHPAVVEALLLAGADEKAQDKFGKTAGFWAVQQNDVTTVKVFADHDKLDWCFIPTYAWQMPQAITANREILKLLLHESFLQQWSRTVTIPEFQTTIWVSLGASVPLTAALAYLQQHHLAHRHRLGSGDPSLGAQQLASEALPKFPKKTWLLRFYETWSATLLPVWTLGYVLRPQWWASILVLAFVLPAPLYMSCQTALQYPAFFAVSSSRVTTPRNLYLGLACTSLRCGVLLLLPMVFFLLHLCTNLDPLLNPKMMGPFINIQKVFTDATPGKCLVSPWLAVTAGYNDSGDECFPVLLTYHCGLAALFLLMAAGIGYKGRSEAHEEPSLKEARTLALRIDEIAEAAPEGEEEGQAAASSAAEVPVWRSVGQAILAIQYSASPSFVLAVTSQFSMVENAIPTAPPPKWCFWKSPVFSVLPLGLLGDIYNIQNNFLHLHWWFGGILMTTRIASTTADLLSGTTPGLLWAEAKLKAKQGFPAHRAVAMLQFEIAWKAIPSLAVGVYAFWFSVSSLSQFLMSFASLLYSVYSLSQFLHLKLDLEFPPEAAPDEDQGLELSTSADLEVASHAELGEKATPLLDQAEAEEPRQKTDPSGSPGPEMDTRQSSREAAGATDVPSPSLERQPSQVAEEVQTSE